MTSRRRTIIDRCPTALPGSSNGSRTSGRSPASPIAGSSRSGSYGHRIAWPDCSWIPTCARLTLVPLAVLYPLSVAHHWGQLTDPLSHTLFVLAFVYLLEDRPFALAAALALGVLAKETAVIVVPAYLACYWRRGRPAWRIAAGLGAACVAAFLAARLPLGWRPGYGNINGTAGLMIGTNLGFGTAIAWTTVPLWENYLHPLLFVGLFVPALARRWPCIDPRLRACAGP